MHPVFGPYLVFHHQSCYLPHSHVPLSLWHRQCVDPMCYFVAHKFDPPFYPSILCKGSLVSFQRLNCLVAFQQLNCPFRLLLLFLFLLLWALCRLRSCEPHEGVWNLSRMCCLDFQHFMPSRSSSSCFLKYASICSNTSCTSLSTFCQNCALNSFQAP